LGAKDLEGYRTTAGSFIKHFGEKADEAKANRILYAALPIRDLQEHSAHLVLLGQKAASAYPANQRILAAALYRDKQYEKAMSVFEDSMNIGWTRAWDLAFVAMVQHRLGKTKQAQETLLRAETHAESESKWEWFERLEVRHLLHEAKSLVRPDTVESL
jgi:hypothetical protein